MMGSFLLQALCIGVAAALSQAHVVSTKKHTQSNKFSSGSKKNPAGNDNYLDLLPIGLLAFEAAGQVCLSRVLSFNDLPTIVLSTLYHDQVADTLHAKQDLQSARKIAKAEAGDCAWWYWVNFGKRLLEVNGGRQKRQIYRATCIICLVLGAITGAQIYTVDGFGVSASLWIATGVKIGCCVAVYFWRGEDDEQGSQRESASETMM